MMNYEQRLLTAAKIIRNADEQDTAAAADSTINPREIGVEATLKPHQVEGVAWLIRRYLLGVNVILGDEVYALRPFNCQREATASISMGLGKTLQAIAFLSYLKVRQKSPGPFLVLCPLSVTDGWVMEIAKFTPMLKIVRYVGDKEHRCSLRKAMYKHVEEQTSSNVTLPFDVLLTTYDTALMDQDFLSQIPWQYAIIDEAQRLKNPSSVLYGVLSDRFLLPRRLLMTGTPIQNNLTELWSLMHFCMPSVFGTLEQFRSTFKEAAHSMTGVDDPKVKEQFKSLKQILKAFMLRRTKAKLIECGTLVLPPLTEITVMTPLVSLQKKVYTSILRKELPKLLALTSAASNQPSLQNIVIQLRKACSHPYLFPGIEPEPYEEGEHLVQASGKLMILDHILQKLHASGHRVLLFAQMTNTLDILQDYMELRKYSYERLDGSIRAEERFAAIRSFSRQSGGRSSASDESTAFIFMISTRAGGVGLNLIAADTVIFYEQDWNPQVDKQALQRAHRIGQMNHVLCINLVTRHSVEEVIMRRAERKLQLSHNVVGDDTLEHRGEEETGADVGDMRSIILGLHMFDPSDIHREKSDELNGEELTAVAEKAVAAREHGLEKDAEKIKLINPDGEGASLINSDPGLDEASYISWVERFRKESESTCSPLLDLEKRNNLLQERHAKLEEARKKAEEKKLAKWEAEGYSSLSLRDPNPPESGNLLSDSGSVHFVSGDCTNPAQVCSSEPTVIFSCVDDSGNWGNGGLFDALARLSSVIPDAYQRASEFSDLHLGDLHFININEGTNGDSGSGEGNKPQWVALGVVQSYNPRRKVPRSDISIPDLERCLSKASFAAAQHSASIHMARIGYQDGSDRSQWYTVERLLRKYASAYGVNIYVYYYRRSS